VCLLLQKGNANLVAKLTWNGAARIPEAERIRERAASLRAGLPDPPAALSLPVEELTTDSGRMLLVEPIDWLAIGSRIDTWSTPDAWSVFAR
jgi:hypothetical protein